MGSRQLNARTASERADSDGEKGEKEWSVEGDDETGWKKVERLDSLQENIIIMISPLPRKYHQFNTHHNHFVDHLLQLPLQSL